MHLQTERLLLRPLQTDDIPALVALWMDEETTHTMGGPRERDFLEQTFREGVNAPPTPYDLWPVVERANGQVVGHCGLLDKDVDGVREVELTYVIAPAFWGRGYATEIGRALMQAAQAQGLTRLVALIDPANTASAAVARKLGFTHERDLTRPNGKAMGLYEVALITS